ncbi:hypothetical protein DYU11_11675 [Fibrisoma montanum]|uniref:Uncharacterized protein n=1 Tax=Fibrisoma montanum TaxID=2305895 RepID=A0A418MBA6_9BACT|nr:hypothetical protein [Fibrisoma montanum]RIV23634.1 hypothetical protein DYU11_11675 [Fibrisoma montanum]
MKRQPKYQIVAKGPFVELTRTATTETQCRRILKLIRQAHLSALDYNMPKPKRPPNRPDRFGKFGRQETYKAQMASWQAYRADPENRLSVQIINLQQQSTNN